MRTLNGEEDASCGNRCLPWTRRRIVMDASTAGSDCPEVERELDLDNSPRPRYRRPDAQPNGPLNSLVYGPACVAAYAGLWAPHSQSSVSSYRLAAANSQPVLQPP